jgi:hypothetical protein
MHSTLIPSLVTARRHACPCGARNEEPYGHCGKCLARITWRRHHQNRSRHRRHAARYVRRAARILGLAFLLWPAVARGDH